MAAIDHWHPVLLSRDLARKPVGIKLLGQELVVFRTRGGELGVLGDRCPHRGMRLSCGHVEADRIVCPYHGWSYDRDGNGESPGTPKLHAHAERYHVRERHGAVWVSAKSDATLPDLTYPGYHKVCALHHPIEAPLEPLLDNFCEVEHTPTTHALFGYQLSSMSEVTTQVELTDETVRVLNRGPQKRIPWLLERFMGVYTGDVFVDDWTTWFSPVHTVYDHWWEDPVTGAPRPDRLKTAVFFTPVTDARTDLFTFVFAQGDSTGFLGRNLLLRPLITRLVSHEVECDRRIVEALADKSPELRGNQLGRFDKALGENRTRLASIYRGQSQSKAQADADGVAAG